VGESENNLVFGHHLHLVGVQVKVGAFSGAGGELPVDHVDMTRFKTLGLLGVDYGLPLGAGDVLDHSPAGAEIIGHFAGVEGFGALGEFGCSVHTPCAVCSGPGEYCAGLHVQMDGVRRQGHGAIFNRAIPVKPSELFRLGKGNGIGCLVVDGIFQRVLHLTLKQGFLGF